MKKSEITCPIEFSVDLLGGKWKLSILHTLLQKSPMRFKELERAVSGITPTVLTTQLRALETELLVSREIFATVPPTVEYTLTEHGKTMQHMIDEIEKWGLSHFEMLKNNTAAIDANQAY
jgi:DNA-binding HxlR family transcriptional regulator